MAGICGWDENTATGESIVFKLYKQIIYLELPDQRDLHNFYTKETCTIFISMTSLSKEQKEN